MGYRLKDKKIRNERLYQFWLAHPDMTYRAIGKVFHLSHVRVLIIIRKQKELHEERQTMLGKTVKWKSSRSKHSRINLGTIVKILSDNLFRVCRKDGTYHYVSKKELL